MSYKGIDVLARYPKLSKDLFFFSYISDIEIIKTSKQFPSLAAWHYPPKTASYRGKNIDQSLESKVLPLFSVKIHNLV